MSFQNESCLTIQLDPRGETWAAAERLHALTCPSCGAFLESCSQLEMRLKALPSSREQMPPALRAELLQQLDESARPESGARNRVISLPAPPFARRLLLPVAMAASLVLGIFLEKTFDFGPSNLPVEVEKTIGLYIADVTHDHFLLERIGRPLEIEVTDPGRLSSWLSASLNFAFELPETRKTFSLQGGRVWHTVGRLSALASYETDSGSRVVLFAVPAENMKLEGAESTLIGTTRVYTGTGWGHEAKVWIDGDLALALTAPEGELPEGWDEVFLP